MIRAKYIMRRGAAIKPDTMATEVVSRLCATGLPGLAVINDQLDVVGVITDFDLLGAVHEGMQLENFTADRVMTKEPITADIDTTDFELVKMMLVNHFTIIPIVKDNKYVGVVSRLSIMDTYVSPVCYEMLKDK
jgi:arabinose-5-phosphate isomerase